MTEYTKVTNENGDVLQVHETYTYNGETLTNVHDYDSNNWSNGAGELQGVMTHNEDGTTTYDPDEINNNWGEKY